ncbi:MAG: M23 family metallopeptidase [Anaerolineae bacterium]|nr:M23 family metallopeptidase [Anaerolineae bacterium]
MVGDISPGTPQRGTPRDQYQRTYVLLPPDHGATWATTALQVFWNARRFTVGGSADDAGIGDLDFRRVIAVNPEAWGDDLRAFFDTYYPGIVYVPVQAAGPAALKAALEVLDLPPLFPPQPDPPRGLPRTPYARTYVLLSPQANADWAVAALQATWDDRRFTIGGSADDAGVGDLDFRRVIAVNPEGWGDDLHAFLSQYYSGVMYVPITALNTYQLAGRLQALCLHDRGFSLGYPTTRTSPYITDDFGVDRGTYFHSGIDLASSWDKRGEEVLSATDGEVVVAGWNVSEPWYGYQVRVSYMLPDGREVLLRYAHFKSDADGGVYVQKHQQVQRGQKLGRPDSTGESTGDHLHFDVKIGAGYVDPALLIDWPS